MSDNKSYLEIKVTFTHIVILLISVILIGIFLFYIGFNAGKTENTRNKTFNDINTVSGNSDEIILESKENKSNTNIEEPDIKKELGLFDHKEKNIESKKKINKITEPVKISRSKEKESYYSIQVGSFRSHLLAKNYAKKFTMMGYQTDISQFQSSTNLWFRVKVGNFKSLSKANSEKIKLEKMEKKKFQTVKIK